MTGLLVSVRDTREAADALAGGATLIDVKEPRHGSLGPTGADSWRAIAELIGGRVPVSVALGELLDKSTPQRATRLPDIDFVKVGLAGCRHQNGWLRQWESLLKRLPDAVAPVAVTYVDWHHADAPPPEDVLHGAGQFGCRAMLWDTYGKTTGCLVDHMPMKSLARLVEQARRQNLLIVLAGSINERLVQEIHQLAPDYIAVRGAVCRGPRTGRICPHLVRHFATTLRTCRAPRQR